MLHSRYAFAEQHMLETPILLICTCASCPCEHFKMTCEPDHDDNRTGSRRLNTLHSRPGFNPSAGAMLDLCSRYGAALCHLLRCSTHHGSLMQAGKLPVSPTAIRGKSCQHSCGTMQACQHSYGTMQGPDTQLWHNAGPASTAVAHCRACRHIEQHAVSLHVNTVWLNDPD